MEEDALRIARQIRKLANYLIQQIENTPDRSSRGKKSDNIEEPSTKGASGALNILISEDFFDKPKDLNAVMNRLREIGRYYSRESVGMNLLNLTKRRVLNRFKGKGNKRWEYVIRK